ncbi:MAG: MerR family transcriptional regulator [Chloroflexi bacterium]|nr:MerR family transcriptional regulator [Chloroflexota bacterium]
MSKEKGYIQIGELAELTGVTQRALRFYEEKGLLKSPARLEGGFRLYSDEDVERVKDIKCLQKLLGFSLAEIKDILEAEEVKVQLKAEWQGLDVVERKAKLSRAIEVTSAQIHLMQQKMEQMCQLESQWKDKLARYEAVLNELEMRASAIGRRVV